MDAQGHHAPYSLKFDVKLVFIPSESTIFKWRLYCATHLHVVLNLSFLNELGHNTKKNRPKMYVYKEVFPGSFA